MNPLLILFDVDGTLIDAAGAGRNAMHRAFRDVFDLNGIDEAAAGVRFAGMTDRTIFQALARAGGVTSERLAESMDELEQCYLRALDIEMLLPDPRRRVLPGIKPLLRALEIRDDVHLGLLTGNLEGGARRKLDPFDLNRYFEFGGFGSDHAERREIGRIAAERIASHSGVRFTPDRIVVVGDTELDIDCARANGFRVVAVCSGWVPKTTLEYGQPDALFDNLTDGPAVLEALGL